MDLDSIVEAISAMSGPELERIRASEVEVNDGGQSF
jgi:hypothetical protein